MRQLDATNGHANGHATFAGLAGPDRMPPQNRECEQGVLGSCLLDNRAIDDVVAAGLRADDFFRAAYGEVWTAILEMVRAGVGVDGLTLAEHLERAGTFEKLGGNELLRELVDAVPHAANAVYYARIVREKAMGRRLIEACGDVIKRCYSNQFAAPDLLCEAQEILQAIVDRDLDGETVGYAALVDETMARMTLREQGDLLGTGTGFKDLDGITGGFRPGELTILAARPGMGKTSLALDFTEAVAATGMPVLFFSVEMGREPLGDRIITNEAGVDNARFQRPWGLTGDERRRIANAANRLMGLPIEVDFSPSRTVAEIAAVARRLKRRHANGLGLVVVDYLQLLDGTRRKNDNREQEVARISKDLKALSRSLHTPVLTLAQLNRELEKRADKTPALSDLRESGSLEQDADVVLLLHRPEYYKPDDRPGEAELHVAKNRNGATGMVPLAFLAETTKFAPLARRADPAGLCDDTSF